MGGKRATIKQVLRSIFRVRTWKLVLILIPLLFLVATLLRFDHVGMVELRDRVLAADKSGEDAEMMRALVELQEYTVSHIVVNMVEENGVEGLVFGTGPFYLEQQYIRRAKEELAKAEAALANAGENPHGNVFQKAAEICDARALQFGWGFNEAYIRCMQDELARYPEMAAIEDFQRAMIPPTALFRRDFASPVWLPSWAGWAILACVLLIVVILIRFVIWIVLKITLVLLKKR
jgi:hypothetical protein